MKERADFIVHSGSKENDRRCVVYARGENGVIYNRLDIKLPPKSKIYRNQDNYLVISNSVFDLVIIPKYFGFNTVVNPIIIDSENSIPLLAQINIKIILKDHSYLAKIQLFCMNGWIRLLRISKNMFP